MFIGPGTDFWGILMPLYTSSNQLIFSEYVPAYIKLAPSIAAFLGGILSIPLFKFTLKFNFTSLGRSIYVVFNYKWYFDHIYNYFLVQKVLYLGQHVSYEILDRGILEKLGPTGIINFFDNLSVRFSSLQSGLIRHYLFLYIFGGCVIIAPYAFLRFGVDLSLYIDTRYFWIIGILCFLPKSTKK
jgi:NADH-ubiquinone oxidoreductase chain 5